MQQENPAEITSPDVTSPLPDPTPVAEPSLPLPVVTDSIENGTNSLSCRVVDLIAKWGLPSWIEPLITGAALLGILAILAFLVFFIVRPFVLRMFRAAVRRTNMKWDDLIVKYGICRWASHFLSALVISYAIPLLFGGTPQMSDHLANASQLYLIVAGLLLVYSVLNGVRGVFETKNENQSIPITSFSQVLKLLAFLVALILIVSTFVDKSPVAFLGGLGVFTSIIMLVFKDAILGFVAGIQLTSNDMIRKGDWVEIPKHGADGDVMEVGLTTVKVMNFDKTVTTVPTYSLISDSFKNWRFMPESGGRRIKRSISIDLKTVHLCTDEMLKRYRNIQYIAEYLDSKKQEIEDWNNTRGFDPKTSAVNGRNLTNIGTFRAYIEAYLRNHPHIHQEGMTLLVRQLQPGPNGVPIEIYCFSRITGWTAYEAIQSDIFDHLLAIAKEFDLEVFQNPTELSIST